MGLLTKAIHIGGVAVAVPAVIGTGLIGGTLLNYIIEPKGIAWLLFLGVTCCAMAVILGAMAYTLEEHDKAKAHDETSAKPASTAGKVEDATKKEADAEACTEAVTQKRGKVD